MRREEGGERRGKLWERGKERELESGEMKRARGSERIEVGEGVEKDRDRETATE